MMIIYEIVCNITGERYIGSTTTSLKKRLSIHKTPKNKCSSKQIITRGDYVVNILEEGDFERFEREQYYMNSLPNINQRNAIEDMIHKKRYAIEWGRSEAGKKYYRDWARKKRLSCEVSNKERIYAREKARWRSSMGGDERRHNNLLLISMDLFK
jgi:hypothetical protein